VTKISEYGKAEQTEHKAEVMKIYITLILCMTKDSSLDPTHNIDLYINEISKQKVIHESADTLVKHNL